MSISACVSTHGATGWSAGTFVSGDGMVVCGLRRGAFKPAGLGVLGWLWREFGTCRCRSPLGGEVLGFSPGGLGRQMAGTLCFGGHIGADLHYPPKGVVRFYNGRGIAEQ